jgi:hypothetical protein
MATSASRDACRADGKGQRDEENHRRPFSFSCYGARAFLAPEPLREGNQDAKEAAMKVKMIIIVLAASLVVLASIAMAIRRARGDALSTGFRESTQQDNRAEKLAATEPQAGGTG